MRAWTLRGGFGLEHLTLEDRPDPEPERGEVVLDMKAWSLNFRDHLVIAGHYNPKQALPLVPLSDGVGRVAKVGAGVDRWQVGDRVMPIFAQQWWAGRPSREALRSTLGGPRDGLLAKRVRVDAEALLRAPDYLSDAEAATLPCAGLTAWSALAELGDVRAGQTILTEGTGGVSIFALQIGQLLGARVIITSSSDDKLDRARKLGAWQTINYRSVPEWGKAARTLTGNQGVDHVIDVGGGGTLAEALRAVRPGGTISLIGILGGRTTDFDVIPILMNQIRVQGVMVGHRQGLEDLTAAFAQHALRPVVDREMAFEQAPVAIAALTTGEHFGKICILAGD
jgi:NADPH:quinone reductase-like Zn-dependent oxidoreductase